MNNSSLAAELLISDLDLANTFLDIAEAHEPADQTRTRNIAHASKALVDIKDMSETISMGDAVRLHIQARLAALGTRIAGIRP